MPEMLSPEQRVLLARVEAFVTQELAPLEQTLPQEPGAEVPPAARQETVARARRAGLYGLLQPAAEGGAEAAALERVIVIEALARSGLRLARFALGPGPGLLAGVEGVLRERYLLPLLGGDKRGALAITEPRDVPPTRAQRAGGTLCLNGRKSYVTGGADADFYLVLAQLVQPSGEPGPRALVVVDRDTPGLTIERRFQSLDGSHHVELALHDVRVPEQRLLPEDRSGATRTQQGLATVRLQVAARASGAAQHALAHARRRVSQPRASGPPLGDDAAVRLRLADMAIAVYAGRSVLYRSARLHALGQDARNQALAAKVLCTESALQVVDRAIALEGGQALVTGHPLERLHRELQALLLAEGASDVLRASLAKGLLEHGFEGL